MNPQAEIPWHPADYSWNPVRLNAVPACEGLPVPEALPHVSAAAVAAAGFAASMRYQGSGLAPLSGLDTSLDPRHRSRSSTVCQVEGCNGSLKQLKEYHQRYKICEHHLKVSSIIREGVRQRFCQQCGRFHDLSEFDGDKRSCRARLQRHNARRRKKADGESALRVSVASRKPSGTGSRRQSSSPTSREQGGSGRATGRHSARQIAALLQDNAAAVSSGQTLAQHHSGDMDGSSELHMSNGIANGLGNGLVPLSAPPPAGSEDWVSGGNAGSASRPRGGQKLPNLENALSELLTDSQARHQGSAVSLEAIQEFLDDGQRQNGHHGLGPMPFAQANGNFGLMAMGNGFPENSGAAFGGLPMSSSLPLSNSLPNTNDLWGMRKQAFQAGGNLSLPPGMGLGGDSSMGFSSGMVKGGGGSNGASPARLNNGLHSMGSAPLPMDFKAETQGSSGLGGNRIPPPIGVRSLSDQSVLAGSSEDGGPQPVGPNSVLHNARALLSGNGMNGGTQEEFTSHGPSSLGYPAGQQLVRVATKLFNCTPDQLPPDLQQNLVSLLSCGNSMQGYIRPGCTHLTLDAVLEREKVADLQQAGVRSIAQALLAGPTGAFWSERTFTLQLFDEVALVRGGRVLSVLSASGSAGVFPSVLALSPRFLAPGEEGPLVALTGANLAGGDAAVLARCNGAFVPLQTVARVPSAAGPGTPESVVVRLPADMPPGAVQLEVTRSGCLSGAAPVLLLPTAQAAAELRTLEHASVRGEELEAIILDMDQVLQYDAVLRASVTGAPLPAQALRTYTPEDVVSVCDCAQRLLILACDQGWPAVAATVLPVACAVADTVGDVMDALQERVAAGLTPLHLAVRSRNAELVELLLGWASAGGYEWSVNVPGPHGISPLHLSVLLPDGGIIAHLLTSASTTGKESWFNSRADDGSTPADWAEARVNELVRSGTLEEDMESSEVSSDAEAEAGPSPAASSGASETFVEEVIQKPHKQAGKEEARRGKDCGGGPEMPPRLYEDYYQDCDMFGLAFAPTVFDRTSSTVTASVILLVGGATLLLRHFVDVLAL